MSTHEARIERRSFISAMCSPIGILVIPLSLITLGLFALLMVFIYRQFPRYVEIRDGRLDIPARNRDLRPPIESCIVMRIVHRTILFFPIASVLELRIPRDGVESIEMGRFGARGGSYRRVDINSVWYLGGRPGIRRFADQLIAAGIQIDGRPTPERPRQTADPETGVQVRAGAHQAIGFNPQTTTSGT